MSKKRNPAAAAAGQKQKDVWQSENSRLPFAGQGCFCAPCGYFRLVVLASGRIRRVCSFTGERLTSNGNPLCEFRHVKGGKA